MCVSGGRSSISVRSTHIYDVFQFQVLVQADYTSIVKVVSYENPTGKSDRDEVCCDYFPPDVETCVSSCHAFYRAFCMKPYQSDLSDCSLGSTTGNFGNNESVIISGVGAWPVSVNLFTVLTLY